MADFDLTVDFKAFQDQVTSSLVNVTRTAGYISNEDLGFHRSSSAKLSKALDEQNGHLLRLTNKLLKAATKDASLRAPKLQNLDSVEDNWRSVVDVVDHLLEKADASLDEFSGIIKRLSPSLQESASTPPRAREVPKKFPNIFQNASLAKPQLLFNTKVNNYETKSFRPLLKTKPHATVSLEESVGNGPNSYGHPYAAEIERSKFPLATYISAKPIPFTPPEDTSAIFVDTEEGVRGMLAELKKAKEIAVDLEHHDMHSYIGLVSLMQISTRDKDWIVDTLKPWRENLQVLNEVFADPNIIKVFHGSNMDIKWLQRDLGLYVVGLFDTYHAAVALDFPGKGLKYLLERFANFKAQKQYQMADWRIRPLPVELLDYARADTHYLLYIYDILREMLLEASSQTENLIDRVFEASKKEALQIYERPVYDSDYGLGSGGWFKQVTQRAIKFDGPQLSVYKAVHKWRDDKAREWDEGEQSILTLANLWSIGESMPTTVPALHNCLRSMSKAASENTRELVEVIKKGKDQGQHEPPLRDVVHLTEEKFGASTVWGRRFAPRRIEQDENKGIGATVQMLTQNGEIGTGAAQSINAVDQGDSTAGRSLTSLLWGFSLPQIVGTLATPPSVAVEALKFVLPLSSPKCAPVAIEDGMKSELVQGVVSSGATLPEPITNGVSLVTNDEIFTLRDRERNKKRKAEDVLDVIERPTVEEANMISIDPAHQVRKDEKQRRKAEKRAKKEAQAADTAAAQPFDYASAKSVLHTQDEQVSRDSKDQKKKKLVNPYAKALDTSTGARRTNKEGPGKSFTFKK